MQTVHQFPFATHLLPHATGRNTRSIIRLGQARCCWLAAGEAGQQDPLWMALGWAGSRAALTGSRNHRHIQPAPADAARRISPLHGWRSPARCAGQRPGGPGPRGCVSLPQSLAVFVYSRERRLALPEEGSQGSLLFTRCSCPKVASTTVPSGTAGLCHAHGPADPSLGSRGCSKGTGLPSAQEGHREALEAHRLQLSLT